MDWPKPASGHACANTSMNLRIAVFGFDRARSISAQSAEQIAEAAQGFGQQDDITVLTLTFAPAEVLQS